MVTPAVLPTRATDQRQRTPPSDEPGALQWAVHTAHTNPRTYRNGDSKIMKHDDVTTTEVETISTTTGSEVENSLEYDPTVPDTTVEELDEVLQNLPVIDTDTTEVRWAPVWGDCESREWLLHGDEEDLPSAIRYRCDIYSFATFGPPEGAAIRMRGSREQVRQWLLDAAAALQACPDHEQVPTNGDDPDADAVGGRDGRTIAIDNSGTGEYVDFARSLGDFEIADVLHPERSLDPLLIFPGRPTNGDDPTAG
jgi:hypothetical protein